METADVLAENRLLDRLADHAWPAQETAPLGGWLLRASGGLTRRANSVLTAADYPDAGWLAAAGHFYHARGLPVRVQVSGGSPAGLGAQLAAQGYVPDGPSYVFTAPAGETARRAAGAACTFRLEPRLSATWLADFLRIEGRSATTAAGYRAIMTRIAPPALFVTALLDEQVVGVGTGVSEQGWAGLLNIATAPEARRRGVASGVVGAIARWAAAGGAAQLYLQVMANNTAAIALYGRLGFRPRSRYYYATEPAAT